MGDRVQPRLMHRNTGLCAQAGSAEHDDESFGRHSLAHDCPGLQHADMQQTVDCLNHLLVAAKGPSRIQQQCFNCRAAEP
jgi:hypothetical protein